MQVIEGKDVDVLSPFPSGLIDEAVGWMHCHKTLVFGDDGPSTPDEIKEFLVSRMALPFVQTFGVVDKHNLTSAKKYVPPLVGIVFFERNGRENGYVHLASSRRAWGRKLAQPGLMEQGGLLIQRHLFEAMPDLTRLSVSTYENNKAARALAVRLGFKQDGRFEAMSTWRGAPMAVTHYGLLRDQLAPSALEVPNGLGI